MGKKVLSQHEKYTKTFFIAQKIVNVAIEASGQQFDKLVACLKRLLGAWQEGKEVRIEPLIDGFKES